MSGHHEGRGSRGAGHAYRRFQEKEWQRQQQQQQQQPHAAQQRRCQHQRPGCSTDQWNSDSWEWESHKTPERRDATPPPPASQRQQQQQQHHEQQNPHWPRDSGADEEAKPAKMSTAWKAMVHLWLVFVCSLSQPNWPSLEGPGKTALDAKKNPETKA